MGECGACRSEDRVCRYNGKLSPFNLVAAVPTGFCLFDLTTHQLCSYRTVVQSIVTWGNRNNGTQRSFDGLYGRARGYNARHSSSVSSTACEKGSTSTICAN